MPQVQMTQDFTVYEADFAALAVGVQQVQVIQIQADANFRWIKSAFLADIGVALETQATMVVPLVTVQITDAFSGRQLFNNPVPVPNVFGTGQIPFILPLPRIFAANTSITVAATNYAVGGTVYNLRLSFIGVKDFSKGYGAR